MDRSSIGVVGRVGWRSPKDLYGVRGENSVGDMKVYDLPLCRRGVDGRFECMRWGSYDCVLSTDIMERWYVR